VPGRPREGMGARQHFAQRSAGSRSGRYALQASLAGAIRFGDCSRSNDIYARPPAAHRPRPVAGAAASPRCARSACASARAGRRCGAPSSLHTSAPSRSSTNVGSARTSSTSPSPCARGAGGGPGVSAPAAATSRGRAAAAPAHLHLFHVGPGERNARELGVSHEVSELGLDELADVARRRCEDDAQPRATLGEGEELRRAGDGGPPRHGRGGSMRSAPGLRGREVLGLAVTVCLPRQRAGLLNTIRAARGPRTRPCARPSRPRRTPRCSMRRRGRRGSGGATRGRGRQRGRAASRGAARRRARSSTIEATRGPRSARTPPAPARRARVLTAPQPGHLREAQY
jgi:hypothetical protein